MVTKRQRNIMIYFFPGTTADLIVESDYSLKDNKTSTNYSLHKSNLLIFFLCIVPI